MGDRIDSKIEDHRRDPDPHPRWRQQLDTRLDGLQESIDLLAPGGEAPVIPDAGTATPETVAYRVPGDPGSSEAFAREDHRHLLELPDGLESIAAITGTGVVQRDGNGLLQAVQLENDAVGVWDSVGMSSRPGFTATDDLVTVPSVKATDQTGTGERVVLAGTDGTQRAEAKATWATPASEIVMRTGVVLGGTSVRALFSDLTSSDVLGSPPHGAAGGVVVSPTGALFALSATGRYIAWSTNNGSTWTEHDYGSNLGNSAYIIRGTINGIVVDGICVTAGFAETPVIKYGAFAYPPTLVTLSSPLSGACQVVRAKADENELAFIGGNGVAEYAWVARRSSPSAWQTARILTNRYVNNLAKTSSGTWLASLFSGSTRSLRRSVDFTTWTEVDSADFSPAANSPAYGKAIQMPSGRIIIMASDGGASGARKLKYSDNDGATWANASHPAVSVSGTVFYSAQASKVVVVFTDGSIMSSSNGSVFANDAPIAVGGTLPANNFGQEKSVLGLDTSPSPRLSIGPDAGVDVDGLGRFNSVLVDDHAGTGQRMQTAAADGTLTPVAVVQWTGTWLQISGADVAAVAANGLVARTAASTFASRTITGPAAGITVTNGDGVAGNPTLALANDLAAYEGLSATGLVALTADGSAAARTLTVDASLTLTNGNGVAGNPTLSMPAVGPGAGSVGAAASTLSITTDAQGRVTARSAQAIAIVPGQVTGLAEVLEGIPHVDTVAPTLSDDSAAGYVPGNLWIRQRNTTVYQAQSVANDAAVWEIYAGGSETWAPRATAGTRGYLSMRGISYSTGVWVAVGDVDNDGFTACSSIQYSSDDGLTWNQLSSGTPVGNEMYTFVGPKSSSGGFVTQLSFFLGTWNQIVYTSSVDGVTWGGVRLNYAGTDPRCVATAYNGTTVVLVGSVPPNATTGPTIMSSTSSGDNSTWSLRSSPADGKSLYAVAYGGGKFLAVGVGIRVTSTDGITWADETSAYAAIPGLGTQLMYHNGRFIFASCWSEDRYFTAYNSALWESADGEEWVLASQPSLGSTLGVGNNGARLVAVGGRGSSTTTPIETTTLATSGAPTHADTRPPAATDDTGLGYVVGQFWSYLKPQGLWIAQSVEVDQAVWTSIPIWVDIPASAADLGVPGQTAYDASYLYLCTGANTWRRIAHASW